MEYKKFLDEVYNSVIIPLQNHRACIHTLWGMRDYMRIRSGVMSDFTYKMGCKSTEFVRRNPTKKDDVEKYIHQLKDKLEETYAFITGKDPSVSGF